MTRHFNYHPSASRWLWPGKRTFVEVDSMVVSWWIMAFLPIENKHGFKIDNGQVSFCVDKYIFSNNIYGWSVCSGLDQQIEMICIIWMITIQSHCLQTRFWYRSLCSVHDLKVRTAKSANSCKKFSSRNLTFSEICSTFDKSRTYVKVYSMKFATLVKCGVHCAQCHYYIAGHTPVMHISTFLVTCSF